MRIRRIKEEHIRFVLENGHFGGYSEDGIGELWRARILGRTIEVIVEWLPNHIAKVRSVWN